MSNIFWVGILLCLLNVSPASADPGASEVRSGNVAYKKEDYSQAIEKYEAAALKAPGDPRIDYDRGAAAYKLGNYQEAVGHFNKALLSDDEKLATSAHYNLGNALYKSGTIIEDKDIQGAIKSLQESLGHYDKVMTVDVKDLDARSNRNFVVSELERLRKKEQEQKQQQDQQKQCPNPKKEKKEDSNEQQKKEQDQDKDKDKDVSQSQQPQDQKNDEDKESQQQKQDQGEKEEQKEQKEQREQKEQKDQKDPKEASSGQAENGHLLSQEEANILLDDFAQNEQPKGMLKLDREPRQEKAVVKDW